MIGWLITTWWDIKRWWNKPVLITEFNWIGPLPEEVSWNWASKNVPLHITWSTDRIITVHDRCPVCGSMLHRQRYDYHTYTDGGGQFMVIADVCPNKHGAHVEWA